MRQPYTLNLKANRRGLTPTQEIKQRSTQKKTHSALQQKSRTLN